MLLPLIAMIFEKNGVASTVNGVHATGLYIGILLASPFMENPLRKWGFKPIILIGGMLVFIPLLLFPLWNSIVFWFILRLVIGIGDHMLHFGTQTWITMTVSEKTRGRRISFYGLSFAIGFALGPLMIRLLEINEALPFFLSALFSMFVWSLIFVIKNKWPENEIEVTSISSVHKLAKTMRIASVALLPGFGYGFLEAALHAVFPVYGLRIGHDVATLSVMIPCFAIGTILFQLPLGIISDRFGRRKVLLFVLVKGIIFFTLAAFFESSAVFLSVLFILSGMFVGSLFSLGMTYMVDILPKQLLPAGNLMLGIFFSLGSISGPFIGGIFIEVFPNVSFFYLVTVVLVILTSIIYLKREDYKTA